MVYVSNAPSYSIYSNIDSTGDAVDFGDKTSTVFTSGGCSSNSCGGFLGHNQNVYNALDFITIASKGNAQDFGDVSNIMVVDLWHLIRLVESNFAR